MVKHIILWKLKDEYNDEQKAEIKKGIKEGLEGLVGVVPGLIDVKVNIDGRVAETSNCDLMLDCTLTDVEALKGYGKNPDHNAVADAKVRPYTCQRLCLDYEI